MEECKKEYDLCEAVGGVYGAQGLKLVAPQKDAAAAAAVQGGAISSEDESSATPVCKKARHHSGSSVTERATETFANVMSAFLPARAGPKLTAADWFSKCGATDEQKRAVMLLLPAMAAEPSTLLLASIEEDDLKACGLSKIQITAWKKLAAAESI
jgi:hypothetical protein